ncbi:MAG: ABC transporter substrate-binding protein, partial [Phycisphaerales bacterium]|nr:ABC transporter substrate-binding protein [Phycisphaerales bacterium]
PSATELLCAIGAADLLVGRSHECDFPEEIRDRPILTAQKTSGTTSAEIDAQVRAVREGNTGADDTADNASLYALDVPALRALRPDVILTQDLCDVCSIDLATVRAVARMMTPEPAIVSLNPASIEDVFDDMLTVGEAVGRPDEAERAMVALRGDFWTAVDYVNPYVAPVNVAFLEWMDPIFVGGHWTPQLIAAAGGDHPLNSAGAKSCQVAWDDVVASSPERLIICPCGYDLSAIRREMSAIEQRPGWNDLPAVQNDQVMLVDGNQMFNRPGPRLVTAFRWLVAWLQDRPEVHPATFPAERWSASRSNASNAAEC